MRDLIALDFIYGESEWRGRNRNACHNSPNLFAKESEIRCCNSLPIHNYLVLCVAFDPKKSDKIHLCAIWQNAKIFPRGINTFHGAVFFHFFLWNTNFKKAVLDTNDTIFSLQSSLTTPLSVTSNLCHFLFYPCLCSPPTLLWRPQQVWGSISDCPLHFSLPVIDPGLRVTRHPLVHSNLATCSALSPLSITPPPNITRAKCKLPSVLTRLLPALQRFGHYSAASVSPSAAYIMDEIDLPSN